MVDKKPDRRGYPLTLSIENGVWLDEFRNRIARASSYPRDVSLNEAFTALRAEYEQRQKLNQKVG